MVSWAGRASDGKDRHQRVHHPDNYMMTNLSLDLVLVEGLAGELKPLYVPQKDFSAGEPVMQVSRAESPTEDAELSHR